MPNHVTNRVTAPTDDLSRFIGSEANRSTGEPQQTFDFRQIVPRPMMTIKRDSVRMDVEWIAKITLGLISFETRTGNPAVMLDQVCALRMLNESQMASALDDDAFEHLIAMLRFHRQTGSLHVMDWNREHWGTKWNAYDVKYDGGNTVLFDTAWSAPHPVIAALAKQVGAPVKHEWADEDTGSNVGEREYSATGELTSRRDLDDTREGYELAFHLRGGAEYFMWDGSKYVYREGDA